MIYQELKRLLSNRLIIGLFALLLAVVFLLSFQTLRGQKEEFPTSYLKEERVEIIKKMDNNQEKLNLSLFTPEQKKFLEEENVFLQSLLDEEVVEVSQSTYAGLFANATLEFLIMLLFSFLLLHFLFFEDVQENLLGLFHTTKSSLRQVFTAKAFVLTAILIFFTALTYVWQCIWIGRNFPVHNVLVLKECALSWGILEILGLQKLLLLGLVLLLSWMLLWFFLFFRKLSFALIATGVFVMAEYIGHRFIPVHSPLEVLKTFNLFQGLTPGVFAGRSLKLFGSYLPDVLGYAVLLGVLVLAIRKLAKGLYIRNKKLFSLPQGRGHALKSKSLFWQQVYNVFILKKSLLLLILLLAYGLYSVFSFQVTRKETEEIRQEVASRYFGPIDQQLMERLKTDEKEYEANKKRFDLLLDQVMNQEDETRESGEELEILNQKNNEYPFFLGVKAEIEGLQEMGVDYYVKEEGVNLLIGMKSDYTPLRLLFLSAILLIVVSSRLVRELYQNGIDRLYHSTVGGRKSLNKINFRVLGILTLLTVGILYGCHFAKIYRVYPQILKDVSVRGILKTNLDFSIYFLYALLFFNVCLFLMTMVKTCYLFATKNSHLVTVTYMIGLFLVLVLVYSLYPYASPVVLVTARVLEQPVLSGLWMVVLLLCNLLISRKVSTYAN